MLFRVSFPAPGDVYKRQVRSSLSYPVISSHAHVPDAARRAMGITPGMLRISVGIEKAEDLIADIEQALSVFDE